MPKNILCTNIFEFILDLSIEKTMFTTYSVQHLLKNLNFKTYLLSYFFKYFCNNTLKTINRFKPPLIENMSISTNS